MSLRQRIYRQLDPSTWPNRALSPVNKLLVMTILIATLFAILETEPVLRDRFHIVFVVGELCFGFIFLIEYVARVWTAPEHKGPGSATAKRLGFIFSFSGLLDLIVLIATFAPLFTINLAMVRIVRLLRIVRLAKLGRLSGALDTLYDAVYSRRFELGVTLSLGAILLVFGATALYLAEGAVQPDQFGSIPRALWWAVITMTTIGYGDAIPVTPIGKFLAAVVAVGGIGLIAMPTGILAAAFSDVMQKRRETKEARRQERGARAEREQGD